VHKTGSKKQLIKFLWNPNPFVITRWCRTCYMILSGPSHLRTDCQILSISLQLSPPFNSPFSMTSQKENTPSLRIFFFFWDPDSIIDQVWITSFFDSYKLYNIQREPWEF
jgi:hypothetical protein